MWCGKTLFPQLPHSTRFGAESFILIVCLLLVLAFDVFDLGTAISNLS
jgi:hypothetical protein